MDMSFNDEFEFYCPKCGDIHFLSDSENKKCIICGSKMLETPHEYNLSQTYIDKIMDLGWKSNKYLFEQNEQRLFDEVISKSPEFDINLYKNRDSVLQHKQRQQEESIGHGKSILEEQSRVPKCPSCGNSNVSKIGVINRAVSFKLVGFASSKIGKTHKCNNCGSMW